MVENIMLSEVLKYWNRLLKLQIFFPPNFEEQNNDKQIFVVMKKIYDLCTLETEGPGSIKALLAEIYENWDQGAGNDFIVFPRIRNSAFVTWNFPNLTEFEQQFFQGFAAAYCMLG